MLTYLLARLGIGRRRPLVIPPLPRHPARGLQVEKGDTVTISNCRVSIHDRNEVQLQRGEPFKVRFPEGAEKFGSGASFGLKRPLEQGRYAVDGNLVSIDGDERSLHVMLRDPLHDPFRAACELADRVLDILSVRSFWRSELDDPLREYSTWSRQDGRTSLRHVTTAQQAVRVRMFAEVSSAEGQRRAQAPAPAIRWHASFAYFRRSQLVDDLHDAYRHLFLALEALLSEVYPWDAALGESRWLKAGLKYVMEGYGLSLNEFVSTEKGNPYRAFLKEQYRARRCALFHSKISEQPTLPGALSDRAALAAATRNLGKLYVCLAKLITGVQFGGSMMSSAAFESMMGEWENNDLYLSHEECFDLQTVISAPATLQRQVNGQQGLYQHVARWEVKTLPTTEIRRAGSLFQKDDELLELAYADVDILLDGVDVFELVFQTELSNADQLREWYL